MKQCKLTQVADDLEYISITQLVIKILYARADLHPPVYEKPVSVVDHDQIKKGVSFVTRSDKKAPIHLRK